ncbi:dihydroorotase [Vulcanisaeta thermophila]|uniref:dihydroorotase n=1 Tax=Vulcanisaeta thermophila TaxID=867917 RepID=UPI0008534AFD|nr:dihydroorotase family protein [Vulcanisaeta thermophila]
MSEFDVVINTRAYINGELRNVGIGIRNGVITQVGGSLRGRVTVELPSNYIVLPGLVDIHVHLRDFELSYKEDINSGTRAALAGGFVALGDMPNTKPPVKTLDLLRRRIELLSKSPLHTRQYFGAVKDLSLIKDARDAGAHAIGEVFPEEVLDYGGDDYLDALLQKASEVGIPVIIHCEDPLIINQYRGPRDFQYHGEIRSPRAELSCVHNIIRLVLRYGARVHLTHLTLPQSIRLIRDSGLDITFDVTPHHMLLSQEECLRIAEKPGYCKVNPPLRSEEVRRELLGMFLRGEVYMVASDHAPHSEQEKELPYDDAPPGIVGLETTAPLLLTLWKRGLTTMSNIVNTLHGRPMKFLNFNSGLGIGECADLTIINTKVSYSIDPSRFQSKARFSPFRGFKVDVAVSATVLHGELAWLNQEFTDQRVIEALDRAFKIIN